MEIDESGDVVVGPDKNKETDPEEISSQDGTSENMRQNGEDTQDMPAPEQNNEVNRGVAELEAELDNVGREEKK